ncbi:MAG: hypothetical protein LWW74_01470 [Burkholderiales bacterium]|jgi:hypothetical protein|nr:hypothetical protein [Burkholderiales bacterium]MCE1176314.1 hypothetical protein [Burkholderiales bacterium]
MMMSIKQKTLHQQGLLNAQITKNYFLAGCAASTFFATVALWAFLWWRLWVTLALAGAVAAAAVVTGAAGVVAKAVTVAKPNTEAITMANNFFMAVSFLKIKVYKTLN